MSIGDSKTLGKVGVKTIGFYLVTTALAVCIALGTALLIHPGLGLNMGAVQKADLSSTAADSSVSLVDTLLNIIPKNPIGSMANGDMLPIIVFALFVGVMLAKLGNRASVVSNFISQFNDVMMEMTMTVMKVAPVGVFCLIARTFATVGFFCVRTDAEIHGKCNTGAGTAVLRHLSGSSVRIHTAESD